MDDTSAVNQKKAQSDETFSLIMHRLKKISTYIYINFKKKKGGGKKKTELKVPPAQFKHSYTKMRFHLISLISLLLSCHMEEINVQIFLFSSSLIKYEIDKVTRV